MLTFNFFPKALIRIDAHEIHVLELMNKMIPTAYKGSQCLSYDLTITELSSLKLVSLH